VVAVSFFYKDTSRAIRENEENGRGYYFESRQTMEVDIKKGEYLEWGEYNGNLYGTKLNTIRQVIQSGKMCIVDCAPKALKLLSNQEYMPYVVFIKCPNTVDDLYSMKLKSLNPTKFKNVSLIIILRFNSFQFNFFQYSNLLKKSKGNG
jgi:guanylate kinase